MPDRRQAAGVFFRRQRRHLAYTPKLLRTAKMVLSTFEFLPYPHKQKQNLLPQAKFVYALGCHQCIPTNNIIGYTLSVNISGSGILLLKVSQL